MNNSILVFAVIGSLAGILLTGCEKTAERKVEDAKETLGDAKQGLKDDQTKYLAEWQTFKSESEQTIEANEKRIDAFKEKMEIAGADTKAKYNEDLAALEQKNRELRKKLEGYKDEGRGNWVQFKTDFSQDMDGIGKSMKDLFNDSN